MLNPTIYADGGMPLFVGSKPMANRWINQSADEIAERRSLALRLRTAIEAAQVRRRTPKLEAVMTNDGIIIGDFYGLDGERKHSRFGRIHGQFEYDEFEAAITFVEQL